MNGYHSYRRHHGDDTYDDDGGNSREMKYRMMLPSKYLFLNLFLVCNTYSNRNSYPAFFILVCQSVEVMLLIYFSIFITQEISSVIIRILFHATYTI